MPWKHGFGGVARLFWEMACAFFSVLCREKYKKGRKIQKRTKKGRKRAEKPQRKRKENATEMPILGFWSGRLRGARGVSAASKGKRGFAVPKCGEPRNKKRGLERDSEGISGIGGFGAFAIVKGAFVRWTRRLGRGATEPDQEQEREISGSMDGDNGEAGARRHAEAA